MKSIFVHPEKNVIDKQGDRIEEKSIPYTDWVEDGKYKPEWELDIADKVRDSLLPFFIKYVHEGYSVNELAHVIRWAIQACIVNIGCAKNLNTVPASIVTKYPEILELCNKNKKIGILDDLEISSPKDYLDYLIEKNDMLIKHGLMNQGEDE